MDLLIFQLLWETRLPMLINKLLEDPEPNQGKASTEALNQDQERTEIEFHQSISTTLDCALLSSPRSDWSLQVVADQVLCGWSAYIPHVCRNGYCWMHRNTTEIPEFKKNLSICRYTQSGETILESYRRKPFYKNREAWDNEWAVLGICMCCTAMAKLSFKYMITIYRSWRL